MRSTIGQVLSRRPLIAALVRADLSVSRQRNRLGWLWWFVDPLVFIAIFWVFKTILLGADAYAPYPMFVGGALIAWRFFSVVVNQCTGILSSRASLIKSVAFPLAVLPVSVLLAECLFLCVAVAALIIVAPFFGVSLGATLVQMPLIIVIQVVFTGGVALLVAGLSVLVYDLKSIMTHLLRITFYMSPAIYGVDLVAREFGPDSVWTSLYMHSPFALLFEAYRAVLWEPRWIEVDAWAWMVGESLVACLVGLAVFRAFEPDAAKMTN